MRLAKASDIGNTRTDDAVSGQRGPPTQRGPVNHLQRQLDDRRRRQKLTYRDLEDLTGMNSSTIWSLVNGPMRQPPKLEQIQVLAKALDWPEPYLQQLVGEQFGYHVYTVESPDLQVVMASWDELSERDRRTIVRMVEELRRDHANNG
jgi:transcriptional regulator with XRE-family HTH domain